MVPEPCGPGCGALAGRRVRAVGAGALSVPSARCLAVAPATSMPVFITLGDATRGALDPKVR